MTRKDFQTIADTVKTAYDSTIAQGYDVLATNRFRRKLAHEFARNLALANDRFDYQWFYAACGYTEGE